MSPNAPHARDQLIALQHALLQLLQNWKVKAERPFDGPTSETVGLAEAFHKGTQYATRNLRRELRTLVLASCQDSKVDDDP